MKSYRGVLSAEEMQAVAAFVVDEFVARQAGHSAYHTAENGWPEHRQRYGAAYPYVLGEARVDGPSTPGSQLYLSACTACHQPDAAAPTWEAGRR
jgi:cytochrome c oxidase cbb3-type subunit 3